MKLHASLLLAIILFFRIGFAQIGSSGTTSDRSKIYPIPVFSSDEVLIQEFDYNLILQSMAGEEKRLKKATKNAEKRKKYLRKANEKYDLNLKIVQGSVDQYDQEKYRYVIKGEPVLVYRYHDNVSMNVTSNFRHYFYDRKEDKKYAFWFAYSDKQLFKHMKKFKKWVAKESEKHHTPLKKLAANPKLVKELIAMEEKAYKRRQTIGKTIVYGSAGLIFVGGTILVNVLGN